MRDVRAVKAWALSITMVGVAHAVACGGSSDGDVAPSAQAGTSQGSSGSSGTSGAGTGGSQGGKSGAAGVAGTGGSPAGSAGVGGASGKAGSAGIAGASGASGGGSAGSAGSAGKATAPCTADAECTAKLPITTPADCAIARCNKASGACEVAAKDADGDGHATSKCKANDATPIIVGDDCDDKDPVTFKGAWDGPKGDGNPDRCDGVDQDCDGVVDSGTLASGATCTCNPGDVSKCSEDSSGKPITFPTGAPLGACKYGSKTCNANGQWSACTGAIAPEPVDRCDAKDENCNGKVDMDDPIPPINQITFTFDGDDDNFADASHRPSRRRRRARRRHRRRVRRTSTPRSSPATRRNSGRACRFR